MWQADGSSSQSNSSSAFHWRTDLDSLGPAYFSTSSTTWQQRRAKCASFLTEFTEFRPKQLGTAVKKKRRTYWSWAWPGRRRRGCASCRRTGRPVASTASESGWDRRKSRPVPNCSRGTWPPQRCTCPVKNQNQKKRRKKTTKNWTRFNQPIDQYTATSKEKLMKMDARDGEFRIKRPWKKTPKRDNNRKQPKQKGKGPTGRKSPWGRWRAASCCGRSTRAAPRAGRTLWRSSRRCCRTAPTRWCRRWPAPSAPACPSPPCPAPCRCTWDASRSTRRRPNRLSFVLFLFFFCFFLSSSFFLCFHGNVRRPISVDPTTQSLSNGALEFSFENSVQTNAIKVYVTSIRIGHWPRTRAGGIETKTRAPEIFIVSLIHFRFIATSSVALVFLFSSFFCSYFVSIFLPFLFLDKLHGAYCCAVKKYASIQRSYANYWNVFADPNSSREISQKNINTEKSDLAFKKNKTTKAVVAVNFGNPKKKRKKTMDWPDGRPAPGWTTSRSVAAPHNNNNNWDVLVEHMVSSRRRPSVEWPRRRRRRPFQFAGRGRSQWEEPMGGANGEGGGSKGAGPSRLRKAAPLPKKKSEKQKKIATHQQRHASHSVTCDYGVIRIIEFIVVFGSFW